MDDIYIWVVFGCHSSRHLEGRGPVTFGGLRNGADSLARRKALRAASTKLEKLLLRGLMARALWTAARVSGHGTRTNSACPNCNAAHEDEIDVLWDGLEWEQARKTWRPWLGDAATAIPHLGPSDQWPARLWRAGLLPLRLGQGVDPGHLDEFLYRLYSMYLAVFAARMVASRGDQAGHGDSLFPNQPRLRPCNPFPNDDFAGPLLGGRDLQPAAPQDGGPAGLAVSPGLLPRLGQVGQGAGLDAGAGGTLVG